MTGPRAPTHGHYVGSMPPRGTLTPTPTIWIRRRAGKAEGAVGWEELDSSRDLKASPSPSPNPYPYPYPCPCPCPCP